MKKVLILAYDFPPYNSIGAQRPYSWYTYFKEFGWEPIVVTRHWDKNILNPVDYIKPSTNTKETIEKTVYGTIVRAPFKPNLRDKMLLKYGLNKLRLIRKTLTLIYQLGEFLVPALDNKKNILKTASNYLQNHKVDLIIATGEPFILFKYADKLLKKHNIKWVADYRDGWSTNYNNSKWEKFLFRIFEQNTVNSSTLLTTVSKPIQNDLKQLFSKKQIEISLNGFADSDLNTEKAYEPTNIFTITYAGIIYPYQRVEVFLEGFKLFVENTNREVICNFYGLYFYINQANRILSYNNKLKKYFNITKRYPRDLLVNLIRNSNLLLVLANENIDGSCTKIYDYFAAKRKILCVVNDNGTLEKQISHTSSGIICNTPDEVKVALEQAYLEWQNYGFVKCNSKNIEQYSRKEQAKKLAKLISKAVKQQS